MPPVRRTRTTRASTRAAKAAAARPAGRPAVLTDQTVNPAPPTAATTGMINLNFEVLTASISAAVQQAVQTALVANSTSGANPAEAPETLVSQAIESEVSAITTNAGQVITNTVSPGPRPATEFRSVAISLAARVSSKIKAKIWAQEYIDLGSLLTISPSNHSYSFSLKTNSDDSSPKPKLCLEPNDKPRRLYNTSQWLTAFNTFVAVYSERFTQAAPQLMKYCETVRDISAKGGDWRFYDEQFRFLRQSDPNLFPWDQIHWELWFQTMLPSRNNAHKSISNPDRDKPPHRFRQQFPKGTCWAFHGGKTCSGSKFEHICFKCGSRHPASQCPTSRGKTKPTPVGDQAERRLQTNNSGKSG